MRRGSRAPAALLLAAAATVLHGTAGAQAPPRSGFDDMSEPLRAMQRDDAQNPGMLWVRDGELLWRSRPAPEAKDCAGCHADAAVSMRGVAARYPRYDEAAGRVVTLAQRINGCRMTAQAAPPWPPESRELLALAAYVGLQSRGMPMSPDADDRLEAAQRRGEQLYRRRIGQLHFACAQCHDDHAGGRLAGSVIPQGHSNGYPLYRLEWQGLGSLQRRLRNCMTGVRAEPYAYDAQELVDLEAWLARRSRGLAVETPAVRP